MSSTGENVINRNSPLPIYYQLKMLVKQQIQEGDLRAGDRLPTEQELCDLYAISRAPVRQALADLVREGFIYRRPGQGTFVRKLDIPRASAPVVLRMLAYDVRWASLLEQAVVIWNQRYPERLLALDISMPSRHEFHRVFRTAVVQGDAPDLVSIDYVWLPGYARAGYLAPLDELAPDWAASLVEDLEPAVYQNHFVNGHLYGLPVQADVTGLWYRRDWFEVEGLKPPETWEAWLDLMDYFARPEVKARWGHEWPGAFPVSMTTGEAVLNLLLPFIWLAGGDIIDAQGKIVLDSPPTYQALHFLRQITLERRYLPPEVAQYEWSGVPWLLGKGAVPMSLGGTYEWFAIFEETDWETEAEVAEHLGFVPIPRPHVATPPVTSLGGTSWVILQQSQHYDLCVELLRLTLDAEVILPFCLENFQISSFRSINQQLATPEHPWMQHIIPLMQLARPRPMLGDYARVSRFIQQMFQQVLWDGAPVEQVVAQTVRSLHLLMG